MPLVLEHLRLLSCCGPSYHHQQQHPEGIEQELKHIQWFCIYHLCDNPPLPTHASLQVPLQLQQLGVGLLRTPLAPEEPWRPLGPGQRRPLHWPVACGVADAALALNLRVSEPGWSWSGGVSLGAACPGELLVKVGPGGGRTQGEVPWSMWLLGGR